jgi:coniferyl-aldehyde dehydrogenase
MNLDLQRQAFRARPNPTVAERKIDLQRLLTAVLSHQEEIVAAVNDDFGGRSRQETVLTEIYTTVSAIRYARKNLADWVRPRRRHVPLTLQPGEAWLQPQPLGVTGIIAPWNFPVNLALIPLVATLAAGNRVSIKPSEYTPATAELLRRLLAGAFAEDHVAVIPGDAGVGRAFASLPFDHLLFTGSTSVGREVMKAASANLTPVTLELGGKSPALIGPGASMKTAAESIANGKMTNAGQICIAPDYVLAPRERLRGFVEEFSAAARRFYPGGSQSDEYTAIINDRHRERLQRYIKEAQDRGVETVAPLGPDGGRKLGPVLLIDPPEDLAAMQDEIFGPVLPVKPYDSLDQAIAFINARPRPLALYVFTGDRQTERQVTERTISGSLCINDTLTQFAVDDLPFGGVGPSGMGRYHGREGFDTFSYLKPVFRTRWFNPAELFRPPATDFQRRVGRLLIGK